MKTLTIIVTIGLIGLLVQGAATVERKFKGDLYFKLISFGSYYYADSISIKKCEQHLDSLMRLEDENMSADDLEFVNYFSALKEQGLIDKPYFELKIDSAIYTVYTSLPEFDKVKGFKRNDLTKANKKVQIELTGKVLSVGKANIISCSTIDKVKVVDGITYWRK
jgi:hypothetical protein